MMMKTACLILLLFLGCLSGIGQDKRVKLDKEFFLLGMLNEYMERYRYGEVDPRVDSFYPSEGVVASVVYSLFKEDYPDLECNMEGSGHIKLLSDKLAEKVNGYFALKFKNKSVVLGEGQYVPVYEGSLKDSVFQTDEQKCSYLAGAYLRYGRVSGDSVRVIQFANSGGKVKVCAQLLEELGCKNVEFKNEKRIPSMNRFTFVPTEELESYLKQGIELKDKTPNRFAPRN